MIQARERNASAAERDVDLSTPRHGERIADVTVTPVPEPEGALVITFQERSLAQRMDRQLMARGAVRSMHGMAAVLAHEIKNPLAGIRGAAQLLEEALPPDEREMTQLIIAESDRIRGLIDRMESFGDTRSLCRAIRSTSMKCWTGCARWRNPSFARGITIVENFDPSLPPVSGDRDQLIQVFLNLVRNAVDALPETGGEITLTTGYRPGVQVRRRPGGRARVAAAGSDGARQWLGRAVRSYAAYFRSLRHHQAARLRPRPGAGRQDRGRSWRRDRMRIPCRAARFSACCCHSRAQGRADVMAATILIADDDSAIRTVLNQALGRAGYDVRTTGTAAGLWRWIAAGEGNLVITDVVLPDESGFDLIPRIKRMRPDLPVLVMSAQNTLLTAITAAERGAFEYLPKPFDLKELTSVVQRALASPQARDAIAVSRPAKTGCR